MGGHLRTRVDLFSGKVGWHRQDGKQHVAARWCVADPVRWRQHFKDVSCGVVRTPKDAGRRRHWGPSNHAQQRVVSWHLFTGEDVVQGAVVGISGPQTAVNWTSCPAQMTPTDTGRALEWMRESVVKLQRSLRSPPRAVAHSARTREGSCHPVVTRASLPAADGAQPWAVHRSFSRPCSYQAPTQ